MQDPVRFGFDVLVCTSVQLDRVAFGTSRGATASLVPFRLVSGIVVLSAFPLRSLWLPLFYIPEECRAFMIATRALSNSGHLEINGCLASGRDRCLGFRETALEGVMCSWQLRATCVMRGKSSGACVPAPAMRCGLSAPYAK